MTLIQTEFLNLCLIFAVCIVYRDEYCPFFLGGILPFKAFAACLGLFLEDKIILTEPGSFANKHLILVQIFSCVVALPLIGFCSMLTIKVIHLL